MTKFTFICVLLGLVLGAMSQEVTITETWDGVDVNKILANEELITSYVRCFLDLAPCTPDGLEAKLRIREFLESRCARCTEIQRENIQRIISTLMEKRQQLWNDMRARFDPSGDLTVKFRERVSVRV